MRTQFKIAKKKSRFDGPTLIFIALGLLTNGLVGLIGCNYNDLKNKTTTSTPANEPKPGDTAFDGIIDFATIRARVFEPACIKCHGPTLAKSSLRLDQYSSAFSRLDLIKSEVNGGTMPPPPPRGAVLSIEQKVLLIAWIDSGGPEIISTTPPPIAAPPPPVPLPPDTLPGAVPDFATVSQAVFQPHCIKCHSNTEEKGQVNLEQYTTAIRHLREIGEALDIDDMPRKAPALPQNLKAIVYAWIDAGGPEFVESGCVHPRNPAIPLIPIVSPPNADKNCNTGENNENEN